MFLMNMFTSVEIYLCISKVFEINNGCEHPKGSPCAITEAMKHESHS